MEFWNIQILLFALIYLGVKEIRSIFAYLVVKLCFSCSNFTKCWQRSQIIDVKGNC